MAEKITNKTILHQDFDHVLKKRLNFSVFNLVLLIVFLCVTAFFAGTQTAGVFNILPRAAMFGTGSGGFNLFVQPTATPMPSATPPPLPTITRFPTGTPQPDTKHKVYGAEYCNADTNTVWNQCILVPCSDPNVQCVDECTANQNTAVECDPAGYTPVPTKKPKATPKPTVKPGTGTPKPTTKAPTVTPQTGANSQACNNGFNLANCSRSGGGCCTDWGVGDGCSKYEADRHFEYCQEKCGYAGNPNVCGGGGGGDDEDEGSGAGKCGDSSTPRECCNKGNTGGGCVPKSVDCEAGQVNFGQAGCAGGQICCGN